MSHSDVMVSPSLTPEESRRQVGLPPLVKAEPHLAGQNKVYRLALVLEFPADDRVCHCPACRCEHLPALAETLGALIGYYLNDQDPFGIFPNTVKVKVEAQL